MQSFSYTLFTVDAHVGKALFADAIIGALKNSGKTIILVTHALHFLDRCDYIYTLRNGRVAEQGTYGELVERQGEFARLVKEFGGKAEKEEEEEEEAIEQVPTSSGNAALRQAKQKASDAIKSGTGTGKLEGRLIRAEKRTTGSVSWRSM